MRRYGAYGTRELVSLLRCLGYIEQPQVGSRHLKYNPPFKLPKYVKPPFILVIQNTTEYDPYWQREYIKQIKTHTFSISQIDKCFP